MNLVQYLDKAEEFASFKQDVEISANKLMVQDGGMIVPSDYGDSLYLSYVPDMVSLKSIWIDAPLT